MTLFDRYYDTVIGHHSLHREVHNFGHHAIKVDCWFSQGNFLIDIVIGDRIDLDGMVIDESACRIALL